MSHDTEQMELDSLLDALGYSHCLGSEAELRISVAAVLNQVGLPYVPEASLGAGDRVDFLVDGRIAVELKVDGSVNQVARQLFRYCRHAQVAAVVLVTTRIRLTGVPMAMAGTPIEVVYVGEGLE